MFDESSASYAEAQSGMDERERYFAENEHRPKEDKDRDMKYITNLNRATAAYFHGKLDPEKYPAAHKAVLARMVDIETYFAQQEQEAETEVPEEVPSLLKYLAYKTLPQGFQEELDNSKESTDTSDTEETLEELAESSE